MFRHGLLNKTQRQCCVLKEVGLTQKIVWWSEGTQNRCIMSTRWQIKTFHNFTLKSLTIISGYFEDTSSNCNLPFIQSHSLKRCLTSDLSGSVLQWYLISSPSTNFTTCIMYSNSTCIMCSIIDAGICPAPISCCSLLWTYSIFSGHW